jgi:hypothetical protein
MLETTKEYHIMHTRSYRLAIRDDNTNAASTENVNLPAQRRFGRLPLRRHFHGDDGHIWRIGVSGKGTGVNQQEHGQKEIGD